MQIKNSGMNYAPKGKVNRVCDPGEFPFGVIGLAHGHINGMCNGLIEAGANIALVYDEDEEKLKDFLNTNPAAKAASCKEEILEHKDIKLVASASIPAERAELGARVMEYGKDFFADKPPVTSIEQLEMVRQIQKKTERRFAVYYAERLHVESSVLAERLIREGSIGRVVQTVNIAPHRISLEQRPPWFFNPREYGGIITDLGSHQIEQFLYFTGAKDASVTASQVANYNFKKYDGFEDFGEAMLRADNGASGYMRVDWFTPDGLGAWGDGRLFVLGTDGYIELRKYIDVARDNEGDHLYLVNHEGESMINAAGMEGFPFFGELITDILSGSRNAFSQDIAFKAMELALQAQNQAVCLER